MINVIVSYRVKPEFVEQNKANIHRFLEDFRKLPSADVQYQIFTKEDGVTFVHYSAYRDEEVQTNVLNMPSFKAFQTIRDESGLDGTHKVEILTCVGSSSDILTGKP